jgi:hypothetical protein
MMERFFDIFFSGLGIIGFITITSANCFNLKVFW